MQQIQHGLVNAGQSMAQAVQGAPGQVFQMLRLVSGAGVQRRVHDHRLDVAGDDPDGAADVGDQDESERRRPLSDAYSALLVRGADSRLSVGPNFTPPTPPSVADWNDRSVRGGAAVSEHTNPDPRWWDGFGDPVLTALMQKAIAGNLDLQQAVFRVVEARQGEISARAAGLPTIGGTGSYMREQLGLHGLLLSQGVYGQLNSLADNAALNSVSPGLGKQVGSAVGGALTKFEQPVNLFQYGLNSSWELDLFGKVRRSEEQAAARTQAQIDATNDALVMLEGQVAQAYVQLRGAQALAASQQENVRTAQAAFDLTDKRQRQGLATDLDVEQART